MALNQDISRKITRRRIWWPLIIGLAVSIGLLYWNLTDVRFEEVAPGTGDYEWVDDNGNGVADLSVQDEFRQTDAGDYRKLTYAEALESIDWQFQTVLWLFMAMIMMVVRDLAYMIRIRILTENQLSWRQAFRVIMMWEFASALTPGVVGGAAVAMFILNKEKIPLGKSTAIVMITAMLDNLFYLVMIPIILILVGSAQFFPDGEGADLFGVDMNIYTWFWIAYGMVMMLFSLLLIGVMFRPTWVKRLLLFIFSFKPIRRWRPGALRVGNEIVMTSEELKGKPRSYWFKAFGATFASWTGRFLVINCIMAAFISIDLTQQLVVYARQLGMWIIMIVSPTPGGSGVAEYAFTEFLSGFIPFGLAGILAVLWRLISYYPYLFIGAILLPRWFTRDVEA